MHYIFPTSRSLSFMSLLNCQSKIVCITKKPHLCMHSLVSFLNFIFFKYKGGELEVWKYFLLTSSLNCHNFLFLFHHTNAKWVLAHLKDHLKKVISIMWQQKTSYFILKHKKWRQIVPLFVSMMWSHTTICMK